MPTPKSGESEQDFVSRCVPIAMDEGLTQDQALGKCYGIYRNTEKAMIQKRLQELIYQVTKTIQKIEMGDLLAMYQPELDDLAVKAKDECKNLVGDQLQFMKEIYVRCRQDGNDVDKSYDITMTIFNREGRKIDVESGELIKAIEHVVESIKDRMVAKQNVGDKKQIFGKPFTWTGSEWKPETAAEEKPTEEGKPATEDKQKDKIDKPIEELTPDDVDYMIGELEDYGVDTRGLDDDEAILQSYNDMVDDLEEEGKEDEDEFEDQMDIMVNELKDLGYEDVELEDLNLNELEDLYELEMGKDAPTRDVVGLKVDEERFKEEIQSRAELEAQAVDAFLDDPDFVEDMKEMMADENLTDEFVQEAIQDMIGEMSDEDLREQIDLSKKEPEEEGLTPEQAAKPKFDPEAAARSPLPEMPGGWVEISEWKRDDFEDPKTYDYLNNLHPEELERAMEELGLDPMDDITDNLDRFRRMNLAEVRGLLNG